MVELAAGDMIPADVRLLTCKDLFLIQGSLTGESFPVEKFAAREARRRPIAPGTDQRLLPGHERRERGRHGGRRGHRPDDFPRRHVRRASWAKQEPTSFDRGMTGSPG